MRDSRERGGTHITGKVWKRKRRSQKAGGGKRSIIGITPLCVSDFSSSIFMFFQQSLSAVYSANCRALGAKPNSQLLKWLPSDPQRASDVTVLDLSRNFVGPAGVNALLATIEGMPCLRVLNLDDNQLVNSNMDVLCRHAKGHPSLQEISLAKNPISLAGAKALLYLVTCSPRITQLNLTGTLVNAALLQRIERQVQVNVAKWIPSAQTTEVIYGDADGATANGSALKAAPPVATKRTLEVGEGLQLLWAALDELVAESGAVELAQPPPVVKTVDDDHNAATISDSKKAPRKKAKVVVPSSAVVGDEANGKSNAEVAAAAPTVKHTLEGFDPLLTVLRIAP